jgi:hypothetical protein
MKKLLCLSALVFYIFACCPCSTTSPPTPVAEPPTAQPPTALPEPTDTPVPPTEAPTSTPAPTMLTDIPTYVVEIEDISVGSNVRFRATVTTEFPISVEQINALCEEIIGGLEPFNAAVVFVYDTRSITSSAFSIAKCEYAPNGVWVDARNVQTGDYSTHKFTYDYLPKVNDPQAALSERPTEQEYDLCQQWDELAFELLSKSDDGAAAENLAYEQVAEENGVSVQAVEDAVLKCEAWTWR